MFGVIVDEHVVRHGEHVTVHVDRGGDYHLHIHTHTRTGQGQMDGADGDVGCSGCGSGGDISPGTSSCLAGFRRSSDSSGCT